MMTAIMQCPNAACGRFSHLGDDPLGRIFRCPHCLTKLPSATASAADAGWTAVVPTAASRRAVQRAIEASLSPESGDLRFDYRSVMEHVSL